MNDRLLRIYLNDHFAGYEAGKRLAMRALGNNRGTPLGDFLESFITQVEEDGSEMARLIDQVGGRVDRVKQSGARAAELLGRLKLNGQVRGYSPLSRLEEIEGLCIGVDGKLAAFVLLQRLARADRRLAADYARLIERARVQREALEKLRLEAADRAFSARRATGGTRSASRRAR